MFTVNATKLAANDNTFFSARCVSFHAAYFPAFRCPYASTICAALMHTYCPAFHLAHIIAIGASVCTAINVFHVPADRSSFVVAFMSAYCRAFHSTNSAAIYGAYYTTVSTTQLSTIPATNLCSV